MTTIILFGGLGVPEILLIILGLLILFGGRKIPELMRGLGQGMKGFKKASRDDDDKEGKKDTKAIDPEK